MPGQHQNGCTNNRVALRDFQLFQMGILHEFKRICEENGLTWWLAYGSLLGAIRHKGFIPWDDDIDVLMPAEDYMRFRELCRTELSDGFYLQVHEDNPCNFIPWQRIGVTSSTSLPHEYVDIHAEWGVCLDIYPLFPCPEKGSEDRHRFDFAVTAIDRLTAKYLYRHEGRTQKSFLRKLYYQVMGHVPDCLNVAFWRRMEKKLLFGIGYEEKCPALTSFDDYTRYPRDLFSDTVMVEFEGEWLPVPAGYESLLAIYYGEDWMELPPEEKRVCHSGGGSDEVIVSLTEPYEQYLK